MWDCSGVLAEIATIETPELGDRSYALFTGAGAVVVDPSATSTASFRCCPIEARG